MASTVATGFLQRIVAESKGPSVLQDQTLPPYLDELLAFLQAYTMVVLIFTVISLAASFGVCAAYWTLWIKPTEEKKLSPSSILPQSLLGGWRFGWCDCFGDCKLCCFSWCFPMCTEAETWYRAGWSQAFIGNNGDSCKTYYGGCCVICCLQCIPCVNYFQVCGCIRGALRGGASSSPAGICGAIPHDLRFGMQGSNYIVNCLQWCICCTCCSLIQEYRQIREAVEHPETIHEPRMQTGMQMMPPMMGPGGQPMMPPPMMPGGQMMAPPGQMMAPPGQMMAPPGQM